MVSEEKALNYFLNTFLSTLKGLMEFKVLRKVNLKDCSNVLITLLFSGKTPSGTKGHFLEVYRNNLIPFLTKPVLQCSYEFSGSLIGCRTRNNERPIGKLLEIPEKDLAVGKNKTMKNLYILCSGDVVFSMPL